MQVALVLLVIVGSTAWLAVDASKRDWTGNGFAKNVPSWVVGSLLLWILVFPMYVFVHRKKAPLLEGAKPQAKPVPAAAKAISAPSEQYGPSLEETASLERESEAAVPQPEPVAEPVVEIDREPVVEITSEPEPVVEIVSEPEPLVEIAHAPGPIDDFAPDPIDDFASEPEPEPEPVPEPEPEPAPEAARDTEPVLDLSYPEAPAEAAPPGLSVDAFKDIKPVAFGGFAGADDEPAAPADAPPADEHPVDVALEPGPVDLAPEPTVEIESEPVVFEPEPEPIAFEPEPEPEPAAAVAPDPEPHETVAAAVADAPPKPKKRGLRLPNPELKLPSFGKKKAKPVTASGAPPEPKAKRRGAIKLPQVTLPATLQGPLSDAERKIALASVVGIVAAAAFGYTTAPSDEAAAPVPAPAPTAASR